MVKLLDEDIAEIERLRVVAMATNFGTKIAINWLWRLMGYIFGCMIASDTQFDTSGGFSG